MKGEGKRNGNSSTERKTNFTLQTNYILGIRDMYTYIYLSLHLAPVRLFFFLFKTPVFKSQKAKDSPRITKFIQHKLLSKLVHNQSTVLHIKNTSTRKTVIYWKQKTTSPPKQKLTCLKTTNQTPQLSLYVALNRILSPTLNKQCTNNSLLTLRHCEDQLQKSKNILTLQIIVLNFLHNYN